MTTGFFLLVPKGEPDECSSDNRKPRYPGAQEGTTIQVPTKALLSISRFTRRKKR
jgi:hypothetical protein